MKKYFDTLKVKCDNPDWHFGAMWAINKICWAIQDLLNTGEFKKPEIQGIEVVVNEQ